MDTLSLHSLEHKLIKYKKHIIRSLCDRDKEILLSQCVSCVDLFIHYEHLKQ